MTEDRLPPLDVDGLTRYMALVMLFGAAAKDATPDQRAELRELAQRLRRPSTDPGCSARDIAQGVFDVMPERWLPGQEYLDMIVALRRGAT